MSYRYLGNKTRLTDWIVGQIVRVLPAGSSIADPMCGTASVSIALARAGYSVTAADALTFPVVLTVYWLGSPDLGPIVTGYIASYLYALGCLAVTSAASDRLLP